MLPSIRQGVIEVYSLLLISGYLCKLIFHILRRAGIKNLNIVTPFNKSEVCCLISIPIVDDSNPFEIRLRK